MASSSSEKPWDQNCAFALEIDTTAAAVVNRATRSKEWEKSPARDEIA
jgi:hypothetical protein